MQTYANCKDEYLQGKELKNHCRAPQCGGYNIEVVDAWKYPIGHKKRKKLYHGFSVKVTVGKRHFDEDGWSLLARMNGNRAHVSSWNSWIYNVFQHVNSTEVLFQQKDDTTVTEVDDFHSFNIVFDWLEEPDLRMYKIYI